MRESEVTVLRSTEERVAQTSRLSVKRDDLHGYLRMRFIFKGQYPWRYGTNLHKNVRKLRIVAKKKC